LLELIEKYDPFKTRYLPIDYLLLGLVFDMEDSDYYYDDAILSSMEENDDHIQSTEEQPDSSDLLAADSSYKNREGSVPEKRSEYVRKKFGKVQQIRDFVSEEQKLEEFSLLESIDRNISKDKWKKVLEKREEDFRKFNKILDDVDYRITKYAYMTRYNCGYYYKYYQIAEWVGVNRNTCKYKMKTSIPEKLKLACVDTQLIGKIFPESKVNKK